jgi:sulfide:quinone oxidoreductase
LTGTNFGGVRVAKADGGAYGEAMSAAGRHRVVIAGGGVAALEAALALRELAPDRVATTLLAPDPSFTHRPLSVLEPFPGAGGRRYPLARLAQDAGADLIADRLVAVDPGNRVVRGAAGNVIPYDALVLAYGTEVRVRFTHAHTVDDGYLADRLRGLVQDVEEGYVRRVAFVAGAPLGWPLPLYELALMTSRAAYDMSAEMAVFIVTPERTPLEVFGERAGRVVAELLARHGVSFRSAPACDVPAPGEVVIDPDRPALHVQSVVAMPELAPRPVPGVPVGADGFIVVDEGGRVAGLDDVYAAGDATAFGVRHGSIAAQQADTAAAEIARAAGADVPPEPFHPVLHGILLGAERPLYMTAQLSDAGHPLCSKVSEEPLWHPPGKIAARRLGPYLHHADQLSGVFSHAVL